MSQKGFVNILIIGIIVIAVASIAGYFVANQQITLPNISSPVPTSTPAQTPTPTPTSSFTSASPSPKTDKQTQSSLGDCIIRPRSPLPDKSKVSNITDQNTVFPDLIDLKFQEGSEVRLKNSKFVSLCGVDLTQINNVIFADSSVGSQRLFTRSEEDLAQEYEKAVVKNPNVADLNLWYRIKIQGNTDYQKLQNLIRQLNSFSIVELATTVSKPAPLP